MPRYKMLQNDEVYIKAFLEALIFSSICTHNYNAFYVLTTALQRINGIKPNLTPWRDSNPGSNVLKSDAMTAMPYIDTYLTLKTTFLQPYGFRSHDPKLQTSQA
jgi:hypothetical protein